MLKFLSDISEATWGLCKVVTRARYTGSVHITKLTRVADLVRSGVECRSKGDNVDSKDNYEHGFPTLIVMCFSTASIGNLENTMHIVYINYYVCSMFKTKMLSAFKSLVIPLTYPPCIWNSPIYVVAWGQGPGHRMPVKGLLVGTVVHLPALWNN